MTLRPIAFVALAFVACGGGSSRSGGSGGTGSPGAPDAGTVSPAADAGTTSAPDAGAAPGGDDAGPGAPAPDAGSADGGTIGSGDTGDAGTPPDECDGIVPGSLANMQSAPGFHPSWVTGSDDGIGHVAFGAGDPNDPARINTIWTLYPTDQGATPSPIASFAGFGMFPTGCTTLSLESQPSGFSGISCANAQYVLTTWSHDGVVEHSYFLGQSPDAFVAAVDPSGGVVVIHESIQGPSRTSWRIDFQRYDKTGLQEAVTTVLSGTSPIGPSVFPGVRGIGINLAGRTLVLLQNPDPGGSGNVGMWIDADGLSHGTFPTSVNPQNTGIMQFLPDGSLALREEGIGWHWAWPDLAIEPSLAPVWMRTSDHANSDFFTIRGGRGFAVQGLRGSIDLVSAQGKTCGSLDLHVFFRNWAVGRDGTLSLALTSDSSIARWWPQLLK